MTAVVPLTHTRGDTFIRNMVFKDKNSTVINLTGATITFTIKEKISDSAALISTMATLTNPNLGLAKLEISADEMKDLAIKNYYYDIQFKDTSLVITTIMKGVFAVTYDITI